MIKFTLKNGQVYGYDSSQQALAQHRIAQEGHTEITEQEANAIANPPAPPLTEEEMKQAEIEQDKKFLLDHDWISSKLFQMEKLGMDTTEEVEKYREVLEQCEAARVRIRINEGRLP